jgi:hypothetical protein
MFIVRNRNDGWYFTGYVRGEPHYAMSHESAFRFTDRKAAAATRDALDQLDMEGIDHQVVRVSRARLALPFGHRDAPP